MHKNCFVHIFSHPQQHPKLPKLCLLFIKPETNVVFMEVMPLIKEFRIVYIVSFIQHI